MNKTASDFSDPTNCLCFNLRRAARLATRIYDEALAPLGLTTSQFSALTVLIKAGPLTTNAFAKAMETERTTSTRNLALMEKQGLIRRQAGDDKRTRLIAATPKGKRVHEKALPVWRCIQDEFVAALGAKGANGAYECTSNVVSALE